MTETEIIGKDFGKSVLLGPIKFLTPLLGYIFLYPLIIDEFSMSVVGIWSLLAALLSYITVADLGFNGLLVREVTKDKNDTKIVEIMRGYQVAQYINVIFCLFLLILVVIFYGTIKDEVNGVYSFGGLLLALVIIICAASLKLQSRLQSALLSSLHDNAYLQVVFAITPIIPFVISLPCVLYGIPIEGLALGHLIHGICLIFIFRRRINVKFSPWAKVKLEPIPLLSILGKVRALFYRTKHFYLISLGGMLRDPTLRVIITITLGLSAAAVYDIAFKIAVTLRDVISSGFQAMYPAISRYYYVNDMVKLRAIISSALVIIIFFGSLAYIGLFTLLYPFLDLWLGAYPDTLPFAMKCLSFWCFLTMLNIPYWYLIQAAGYEKTAAYSLWLHTSLCFVLIPISNYFELTLDEIMLYWLSTSVFTQLGIYWISESKLSLFFSTILNRDVLIVLGLGAFIMSIAATLPPVMLSKEYDIINIRTGITILFFTFLFMIPLSARKVIAAWKSIVN